MQNIGKIICVPYCNGFGDGEYDMMGALVIAEGDSWIVCKKRSGRNVFIDFQAWDSLRDEDGQLIGVVANLRVRKDMQELIDAWTNKSSF